MRVNHAVYTAVIAMLAALPVLAVTPSWSYINPSLSARGAGIHSACMMPAEANLSKLGMKGREGMSKETDAWSTTLQTVVESHLKLAGVELKPVLPADTNASDDELRQIVFRLQERYDGISVKIKSKPKAIGKSRYTLGDEVALLPCASGADVIVFVSGEGRVLTGGKKAFDWVLLGAGSPISSGGSLVLSMADAKSGEIVAFVRLSNAGKFLNDSERAYGKALDKQFRKMRLGASGSRGK